MLIQFYSKGPSEPRGRGRAPLQIFFRYVTLWPIPVRGADYATLVLSPRIFRPSYGPVLEIVNPVLFMHTYLPEMFYGDCIQRCCFMFFPKSFQNLSLNCKSLLFSSFCHSELQMPQVISWQICFDFKLLLKSHYSNIFVIFCCW